VAKCFHFRKPPHIGHKIAQQTGVIIVTPDQSDIGWEVQISYSQQ